MDAAIGQVSKALAGLKRALATDTRLIAQAFAIGSERQRLLRLGESWFRAGQLLSLIIRDFRNDPEAVRFAADQLLSRKGLVADALALQRDVLLGEDEPELRAEFRELVELRTRIAQAALAGPGSEGPHAHRTRLADETRRAEELEIRLARRTPRAGPDALLWSDVTSRVARSIPPEAALIEFVRYTSFDFSPARPGETKSRQTQRYAAFVLISGEPERPRLLDLGEAAVIDRAVEGLRSVITGEAGVLVTAHRDGGPDTRSANPDSGSDRHLVVGRSAGQARASSIIRDAAQPLFQTVFAPLLDALGGRTRLFLSPDGDLNRLPFDVLPLDDDRWVIDEYFVSYLGVGRDIVRLGVPASGRQSAPLVLADPDYNLGESAPAPSGPGPRVSFDRLPGTLREGEEVARLLGVEPLFGAVAMESRLKASRSPVILHLATHGFVLDYKPVPILDPHEVKAGMVITDADPHRRLIALDGLLATPPRPVEVEREDPFVRLSGQDLSNPLARSGLALAGANTWLNGGTVPAEAEDGILNAQDVAGLDLSGTEPVVLSACDSGLGEVHGGEGVFGLRRTFALAGARTLVMSLWKVPDRPTQELMLEFYRRVMAGEPRASALREAQRAMKKRIPAPRDWGAFVCFGDPGPLPPTVRTAGLVRPKASGPEG